MGVWVECSPVQTRYAAVSVLTSIIHNDNDHRGVAYPSVCVYVYNVKEGPSFLLQISILWCRAFWFLISISSG